MVFVACISRPFKLLQDWYSIHWIHSVDIFGIYWTHSTDIFGIHWDFTATFGKKVVVGCHVSDSGLLGNWKHPCELILNQYMANNSGPKGEISVLWNWVRSLSGLSQQGASYYISWIPGPWVSLAWKRSSACSYEENRKTHFSVEWYWTGSLSCEDILARGKCSLRKAPAGSSNLSLAIHEILSDSFSLPKWLGTESELLQEPVFSFWQYRFSPLYALGSFMKSYI